MRLSSSPSVIAKVHADRIETLTRKLDGLSHEKIKEIIKNDLVTREAAAKAFTWSDESEVRELFDELTYGNEFAFCLANKHCYNALLKIARSQFEDGIQPTPPTSPINQSEIADKFPYDYLNRQLLKNFLSQRPGYKRSHLTLSKVEIRNKKISILMQEYKKALPHFDLGTHNRNHNSNTIVSLFSGALGMSESKLQKIWERKETMSPKN
ncbi:MAG: hypothetical protein P8P53_08870 [Tateyamaria sp.]|nr:hypothetical protein [Tateyamaria sp.]